MKSKWTVLLCVLMLVLLVEGASVSTAQAAPPATQPTWFHFSSAINANIAASAGSLVSRIWMTKKMLVVVCTNDTGTATLEPKGTGKVELKYKECKPFKPEENANKPKQFEEGAEYAGCTVKTAGAANGEIIIKNLKTRLVWWNSVSNQVVNRYAPEAQPFVEIEVEGATCTVKGTYKIEGSVLGIPQAFSTAALNQEVISNMQYFDVVNEEVGGAAKIRQSLTPWIVEGGGCGKEGISELALAEGAATSPVALESMEQVEFNRVSNKRGLFAPHE